MSNSILTDVILLSKNSLSTVLEVVITPCPPVVQTLSCQHIDVALGLLECHSLASGEDSVLQISDKRTTTHEAREITLSHKHHFDQNDDFLGILLESLETACHTISEVSEPLRVLTTHDIKHLFSELEWFLLSIFSPCQFYR